MLLVVKIGGTIGVDRDAICTDVADLVKNGEKVVVVHGGSAEIDALSTQLGYTPRFLTSTTGVRSRYTDATTLDILTMAMVGRVKTTIVTLLQQMKINAVGLSGFDGALLQAKRKPAIKAIIDDRIHIVRDDLTGRIQQVNTHLLQLLLEGGYAPVVSPPAFDPAEGLLNVDADRTAAAIASALGAEHLIMLSNVPGVLRDPADPGSLVTNVPPGGIDECLEWAKGRMKLKLIAAREALANGVPSVIVGDSRLARPVYQALAGEGTTLRPDALSKQEQTSQ